MILGRIVLMCLILLTLCHTISSADEKSHYEMATKVIDLTFSKKAYHDSMVRFAQLAIQSRWKNDPVTAPYSDLMGNAVMEVVEAYIDDSDTQKIVKRTLAQLYVEQFSEAELREIIKFYRTKVGQKYVLKYPIIVQKQWELGGQFALSPKYQQMVKEKLEALQAQGKIPREWKLGFGGYN